MLYLPSYTLFPNNLKEIQNSNKRMGASPVYCIHKWQTKETTVNLIQMTLQLLRQLTFFLFLLLYSNFIQGMLVSVVLSCGEPKMLNCLMDPVWTHLSCQNSKRAKGHAYLCKVFTILFLCSFFFFFNCWVAWS